MSADTTTTRERPMASAVRLERTGDQLFEATIPEGWHGAVGVFGGLTMCTLARAAVEAAPGRALRIFSSDFCGPATPGQAAITIEPLRQGGRVTCLSLLLTQQGKAVCRASATLGDRFHTSLERQASDPPEQPAWLDIPCAPVRPPSGPEFGTHFEYRSTGPKLFQAEPDAVTTGWLRESVPVTAITAETLVGMVDAWWTAVYIASTRYHPGATLSCMTEITADPATIPVDRPLFCRSRLATIHDGYAVELRELWSGRTLVAANQQTLAILD